MKSILFLFCITISVLYSADNSRVSWQSSQPFRDSKVTVNGQSVSVVNGGTVISTKGITAPFVVSFTFSFTGSEHDSFRIYTRSDEFGANGYGVKSGIGVSFRVQSDTGKTSQNVALENKGIVLASCTIPFEIGAPYSARLVDTGTSLALYWAESPTPIITAPISLSYGDKISVFNREGAGNGSGISAGSTVAISSIGVLPWNGKIEKNQQAASVAEVNVASPVSPPREEYTPAKVGMSETELLGIKGRPSSSLVSSKKSMYQWPDLSVEAVNGKITKVDIKKVYPVGELELALMKKIAFVQKKMEGSISRDEYENLAGEIVNDYKHVRDNILNGEFDYECRRYLNANIALDTLWRMDKINPWKRGGDYTWVIDPIRDREIANLISAIPAERRTGITNNGKVYLIKDITPVANVIGDVYWKRLLDVFVKHFRVDDGGLTAETVRRELF